MSVHKVCRNCQHHISSSWVTNPICKKCNGFDMFERKEDKHLITIDVSSHDAVGAFKSPKEANEALAQKYGNRKEYNKMNLNKNISVSIGGKYFKPISCEATFHKFEYPRYNIEVEVNPAYMITETTNPNTLIKKVIFNPPATIVFWADNSKTVVKTQNDEEFDPEKGLAMAIAKKAYGNKRDYYNTFKKWTKKYKPVKSDDECQTK